MTRAVLGIDIAKETVAVALLDDTRLEQATFPNTLEGAAKLLTWLHKRKVPHVHACMEATGTYGEALALTLHEAGHVVSVVNPARIAAYAKSHTIFALLTTVRQRADEKWWRGCGQPETVAASR